MSHLLVIGAGHVGLITAVGLMRLGHRVTVADIDADRIRGLQYGTPPVFEPGLAEAVAEGLDHGTLAFTTQLDPPPDVTTTFVCVSTPVGPNGPLDTSNVEAVVARLRGVGTGHTVVVRSTLPLDGPTRLRSA